MTAKTGKPASKGRDPRRSYAAIIERIFLHRYKKGQNVVEFTRQDLIDTAHELGVDLPKNIGDVVYCFGTVATYLPPSQRHVRPRRVGSSSPPGTRSTDSSDARRIP